MTVAEYIASQLAESGVRYVFGIPGGPSIPYMEAFREKGIEFILVSHESAAGIMADVTARLTGVPGACHATFGPGATNISTGAGGALLDRSPVLVLTSEIGEEMIGRTTQMNINHQDLFRPLTKATFRLTGENALHVLPAALKICMSEYPGPVHIGLPSDICNREVHSDTSFFDDQPEIQPWNDKQRILSLIRDSVKPLIAAGLTAARLHLGKEILELAGTYNIPVVTTPMAKGIIPADHPCHAGVLFHSLSDIIEDLYAETDLVIGVGYDPVEFNYESWMPDIPLVHFDVKETDMPESAKAVRFTGPPDQWFALLRNFSTGSLVSREGLVKSVREEMKSVFAGFTGHFGPASALRILRDELPREAVITADVGSHLHLIGQFWETTRPGNLLMTNGWSGMGFGIPAALAAQLNDRNATVVCITGDGGFLMMAGEMITARRYNLPVIIVVFSDGELNLIKVKQSWKDIAPYGTILYNGDLFGSDSFLGIKVITADSAETMTSAINNALALNEPVIINAIIDPDDYKWLIVKR